MKKLLFLAIVVLIVLVLACTPPQQDNPSPAVELVPLFANNTATIPTKSMLTQFSIIPVGTSREQIIQVLNAPILTAFDTNNLGGYVVGDKYKVDFLNTTITITIESSGDKLLFTGNLDDGSGVISLAYDRQAKTFDYNQILIVRDSSNVLGNPDMSLELAVYTKITEAAIDSNGYFHTTCLTGVYCYDEFTGSPRNYYQGFYDEIYRGEMETGQVGTGFCFDQGINNGTVEDATGFDESSIAGHIDNTKLNLYKSYLSLIDPSAGSVGGGMVCYKLDANSTINLTNVADYTELKNTLPSIWKANILLQE